VTHKIRVIPSAAKDLRSFSRFNDLGTTAEILRCAQDDKRLILSLLQSNAYGAGRTEIDSC
jgi:hypothetical protein